MRTIINRIGNKYTKCKGGYVSCLPMHIFLVGMTVGKSTLGRAA